MYNWAFLFKQNFECGAGRVLNINLPNRQGLISDIWALGAVILEILLDKKLWDIGALRKGADQTNIFDVLRY